MGTIVGVNNESSLFPFHEIFKNTCHIGFLHVRTFGNVDKIGHELVILHGDKSGHYVVAHRQGHYAFN